MAIRPIASGLVLVTCMKFLRIRRDGAIRTKSVAWKKGKEGRSIGESKEERTMSDSGGIEEVLGGGS